MILAWLAGFDAHGWQERWTVAAGDEMVWLNELVAANIGPGRGPVRVRDELLSGLRALIFLRAIRPGYTFFYNDRPTLIHDLARQAVETEAIDRCEVVGASVVDVKVVARGACRRRHGLQFDLRQTN